MKYIINKCYGVFHINPVILDDLNLFGKDDEELRTNNTLIGLIEKGEAVGLFYSKPKVVEIPDEATDWELNEYDGFESITYVLDGKLHHI